MHREGQPPLGFILTFGAINVTNTAAARFLPLGYAAASAPATTLDFPVSIPMTVFRIDFSARVAGSAGQTMTGVLRKNGAATAATLATASNATTGSQVLATPVSFVPGDTIGFEVDKSTGFTSPTDLFYTIGVYN